MKDVMVRKIEEALLKIGVKDIEIYEEIIFVNEFLIPENMDLISLVEKLSSLGVNLDELNYGEYSHPINKDDSGLYIIL